jgi:hypothetical protein
MIFYKRTLSLLVFSAPLINFSLFPGSKLPLYYLIGIAAILIFALHNHNMSLRVFGIEDIFFVCFLGVSIFSWYINRSEFLQGRGLSQIVNHFLTYLIFKFALILLHKTRPDPNDLLRKIFVSNTIWQIPAIAIFFIGVLEPKWLVTFLGIMNNSGNFSIGAIGESLETARSFGFAPEPSFWSFFIGVNLAIALILPRPNAILLSINFLNLLLTVGRTGFLIATCVLVIRFAKASKLFTAFLLVFAFAFMFFGLDYLDLRALQSVDNSFFQRIDSLFVALDLIKSYPAFGIGLGNFRIYSELNNLPYLDIFNLFLNLLVGVGVAGFLCYMATLYFSFQRVDSKYNLPFYAAIIGWMTVSSYNLPFVWIIFSIVIYSSEYRRQSEVTTLIPQ